MTSCRVTPPPRRAAATVVPVVAAPVSTTTARTDISQIPATAAGHSRTGAHFAQTLSFGYISGPPRLVTGNPVVTDYRLVAKHFVTQSAKCCYRIFMSLARHDHAITVRQALKATDGAASH